MLIFAVGLCPNKRIEIEKRIYNYEKVSTINTINIGF